MLENIRERIRQIRPRVVITGMGAITPLGNSVRETWDGLVAGQESTSGIRSAPGALMPDYSLPFKQSKERLLEAFEREYLRRLLANASGSIAGAARVAGVDRKHLYTLMEKHGMGRTNLKKKGGG